MTVVCSLLRTAILTWGRSLNGKIDYFASTQARLQQPFPLRHVSFAENQEMAAPVLLRLEVSSEKRASEAGLCCPGALKPPCQSGERCPARRSSHEGHPARAPSLRSARHPSQSLASWYLLGRPR